MGGAHTPPSHAFLRVCEPGRENIGHNGEHDNGDLGTSGGVIRIYCGLGVSAGRTLTLLLVCDFGIPLVWDEQVAEEMTRSVAKIW